MSETTVYDFRKALELHYADVPIYALIMAAMMKADSINTAILQRAYPKIWVELDERYNAPGGVLEVEV